MTRGKQTCRILKEIRRQIAEANQIELVTEECRYKGDCRGTCPRCEAEVRYLEQQLRARQLIGKAVALAGISAATIAMMMPINAIAQSPAISNAVATDSIAVCESASTVKGILLDNETDEPLIGATIVNLTTGQKSVSNMEGLFEIEACEGDSIKIEYVDAYISKTIRITDRSKPISVAMFSRAGAPVYTVGMSSGVFYEKNGLLDLTFVDEKGNSINPECVRIYKSYVDNDGNPAEVRIYPYRLPDTAVLRLNWLTDDFLQGNNGKPLKSATFRFEADGYGASLTKKIRHPRHDTSKTIRFKHK